MPVNYVIALITPYPLYRWFARRKRRRTAWLSYL
jgi:hypothetical protein